ncbi:MAG: hypothetical protein IPM64_15995 [Phycisphaerales bacterium]|nr:hypothetical protein [Phycisphaerales bacterium]
MHANHSNRLLRISHRSWNTILPTTALALIGLCGCEGSRGPDPAARDATGSPTAADANRSKPPGDSTDASADRHSSDASTADARTGSAPDNGQPSARSGTNARGAGATTHGNAGKGDQQAPSSGSDSPAGASSNGGASAAGLVTISEVIERVNDAAPHRLVEVISSGNRLSIKTENVRRLRLHRSRAPGLTSSGSVAIQIDGQGVEWLVRTDVLELERSASGAWAPAAPR